MGPSHLLLGKAVREYSRATVKIEHFVNNPLPISKTKVLMTDNKMSFQ